MESAKAVLTRSSDDAKAQELYSRSQVVARISANLDEVLRPLIGDAAGLPLALLDFPDHANVGDSAIFGGEMAWLKNCPGVQPSVVESLKRDGEWDDPGLPAGTTILLHGGGNFGDIYPRHQAFRVSLFQTHRDHKIVQLPQSIHYDDPAGIDRMASAIASHPDFTLLTRDHESFALAERHFHCTVAMCPDMAFALGELDRPVPATYDVLMLMRGDTERASGESLKTVPQGWRMTDWMNDDRALYEIAVRDARLLALRSGNPLHLSKRARRRAYYESLARQRIVRGVSLLSAARYVITDRLHAHILCTLLGIPHAFLDNRYGKIARFSAAFQSIWDEATRADDMAVAIGAAEDWLARNGSSNCQERRA